ncbi:MAG TPA: CAP domain-containing protein [Thermoleophilaceae bacterium]|nr:CAP domain-containing protein [Thermoleophilaceae bacterium]
MDAGKLGKVAFAATGVAALFATTAAAQAVPRIESTRLDDAIAGRQVDLRVRATDPQAPVTGMVVGFGRGESGFGLSSCLPRDSAGGVFSPVALPGRRATLSAPHVFATPGTRQVAARVTSAGCTGGQPSTLLRLRVPVVAPGQKPRPIQDERTQTVPLGAPVPALPGLGRLPLSRVDLPLPGPVAGTAAGCPESTTRVGRSLASRRAGRRALLCLLNAERRRHGLRAVRANRRLARAAGSHSRRMVQRRFFAHVGPGSLDLTARLRNSRYIPRRGGNWLIGENIGFGRGRMSRPMSMHRAWMNSSPHRAAILERRFREAGFGIAPGSPYRRGGATFTVDFGRRG